MSEIRYPLVHFSFLCQCHLDFGIIAHWYTLGQVLGYLQLYSLVLLISLVIHDLCSSIWLTVFFFFCLAVWRMSSEFWKKWNRFCRLLLVTAIFMISILPIKEHGNSFHCLVSSLPISWRFHYRIFSLIWIGLFCFYFSDYECNIFPTVFICMVIFGICEDY